MRNLLFSMIVSCSLLACNNGASSSQAAQSDALSVDDTPADVSALIANGQISNFPYLNARVALVYIQLSATRVSLCSASLIAPDKVLTAAHCVLNLTDKPAGSSYSGKNLLASRKVLVVFPKNLNLALNIYSPQQSIANWNVYKVAKIYAHRQAFRGATITRQGFKISDPTDINDLALLKLTSRVSSLYKALPLTTTNPPLQSEQIIAGYGVASGSGVILSDAANGRAGVLRLAKSVLSSSYGNGALLNVGGMLNPATGYTKTCAGDSGGPDLIYAQRQYFISGVHSFGDGSGCGSANKPSTSISVAYYNSWISGGYLSNSLN